MYTEFGHINNRDTWKFTFTGAELVEPATVKCKMFEEMENKARESMAVLLNDKTKSATGSRADSLKKRIAFAGAEHEKCRVWATCFERSRDTQYHLALSDVVYFGLVKDVKLAAESADDVED